MTKFIRNTEQPLRLTGNLVKKSLRKRSAAAVLSATAMMVGAGGAASFAVATIDSHISAVTAHEIGDEIRAEELEEQMDGYVLGAVGFLAIGGSAFYAFDMNEQRRRKDINALLRIASLPVGSSDVLIMNPLDHTVVIQSVDSSASTQTDSRRQSFAKLVEASGLLDAETDQ